MDRVPGLRQTLIAAAIMAVVSAFADAFWAAALPEHRAVYGVVHGALLLGAMGAVLAALVASGRVFLGAVGGLLIGVVAAATFYVLYGVVGVLAMVIAWAGLWLAFAGLAGSLATVQEPTGRTVMRAAVAAMLSALAFWAISDIWLGEWTTGPLYVWNAAAWFVAFLPGFAALLLYRPGAR